MSVAVPAGEPAAVSPARPSRKQARRDALFLLYQREVTGRPLAELVDGHRLREGYAPDDFTIGGRRRRDGAAGRARRRAERALDELAARAARAPRAQRPAPRPVRDRERPDAARGGDRRGRAPHATLRDRRGRRARQRHPRARSCASQAQAERRRAGAASDAGRRRSVAEKTKDLARLRQVIDQLDELTTRLGASSSAEVEMSLLERADRARRRGRAPARGPGGRRGVMTVADARRPARAHPAEEAAYPVDLLRLVDDYLAGARLRRRPARRPPRRGDALLAARRRQAHPPRARAGHGAQPRRRPGAVSCPRPPRSSSSTPTR